MAELTKQQQLIYEYLLERQQQRCAPPNLVEICTEFGLKSRGSLHKHIKALEHAGLVKPMQGLRRGVHLLSTDDPNSYNLLPLLGSIAAGQPIEALENAEYIQVPDWLKSNKQCYVLQVKGDSMSNIGILHNDKVIIEQCDCANNGDIVVALIDNTETTLKRIEQKLGAITLYPENSDYQPMVYEPDQVKIQGVLIGQMRSYR